MGSNVKLKCRLTAGKDRPSHAWVLIAIRTEPYGRYGRIQPCGECVGDTLPWPKGIIGYESEAVSREND